MATPTNTTAATAVSNDQIDLINKIVIGKKFNGTMAVTAKKAEKIITVAFAPSYGNAIPAVNLEDPTLMEFLDKVVEVTEKAHQNAIKDLETNASGLIVKVVTHNSARGQLKDKMTMSQQDVNAAVSLRKVELDAQEARAEHVKMLKAELAELEG